MYVNEKRDINEAARFEHETLDMIYQHEPPKAVLNVKKSLLNWHNAT